MSHRKIRLVALALAVPLIVTACGSTGADTQNSSDAQTPSDAQTSSNAPDASHSSDASTESSAEPTEAAPSGEFVLGSQGGKFEKFVKEQAFPVMNERYPDITTRFMASDDPATAAKLAFEANAPTGSFSALVSNMTVNATENAEGYLQQIDYSRLERGDKILDSIKSDHQVTIMWAPYVIQYNTDKIKQPPTSWADLWNPEYQGRVGMMAASDHAMEFLFAATAAKQGAFPGDKDWDIPYDDVKELAKNAKMYPGQDDLGRALLTGEVWITINTLGRAIPLEKDTSGEPLAHVIPQEGTLTLVTGMTIPKNSSNVDAAYALANTFLDPDVQGKVAEVFGYMPAVSDANIDESVRPTFTLTAEQQALVHLVDGDYLVNNSAEWSKFWTRDIVQG